MATRRGGGTVPTRWRRRHAAAATLALCATATLPGCLPLPGYFSGAPRVQGTVVRDGVPVAGAAVWWAGTGVSFSGQRAPDVCENEEALVETRRDGAFTLPGKPLYAIMLPLLPFHCPRQWNVCVSKDGQTRSLPVYGFYGICWTAGPSDVSTVCDLDRAAAEACTSQLGDGR